MLIREYPPDVYGGAGVHVEYLARELARLAAVEVRTFGHHDVDAGRLQVRGHGAAAEVAGDPEAPYMPALRALRVSLQGTAAGRGALQLGSGGPPKSRSLAGACGVP
jgi:alpha-maltose-1-phosphate synthase